MQIQTLLFRQRRHHCLCVLQLNNVQAFVLALSFTVHPVRSSSCALRCSSPRKVTGIRGLRASPLLSTFKFVICFFFFFFFVICVQSCSSVARLAQMRGSSTWDTTVSFDSCTNRHRSGFTAFESHVLCEIPVRHSVKSLCSHAIHRTMLSPNPTIGILSFRRSDEHFVG